MCTHSSYHYWITFIDNSTHFQGVFLLKAKSDASFAFKQFKAYAENQTGQELAALRNNKGGEYMSKLAAQLEEAQQAEKTAAEEEAAEKEAAEKERRAAEVRKAKAVEAVKAGSIRTERSETERPPCQTCVKHGMADRCE